MGSTDSIRDTRFFRVISAFVRALRDEAQAQRRQGGRDVEVTDGLLLDNDLDGGTYRFDLHSEVFLPSNVPVVLKVAGQQYEAEVLHREGDWLYLFAMKSALTGKLPEEIPSASITAAPWFLHEELANRLEDVVDLGAAVPLLTRIGTAIRVYFERTGTSVTAGGASLSFGARAGSSDERAEDESLNPDQRAAIAACIRAPLSFVWGPPGTGKTSTLGRLVARLAETQETLLVTAHANVAVDAATLVVCTAFGKAGLSNRVVRVGPPADPRIRELGVSSHDLALARRPDLAKHLRSLETQLANLGTQRDSASARRIARELKEVRAALQEEERDIITHAPILLATLPKSAITAQIYQRQFSTVIVDEASMAYPPQVVFAATLGLKRLSIFGDFRQLPPIVLSESLLTQEILGRDVFDLAGIVREVDSGGEPVDLHMLRVQYRMHPQIRELVSRFAYSGRLQDSPEVRHRSEIIVQCPPRAGAALVVVDTASLGAAGWRDYGDRSRWNPVAAVWAFRVAYDLALSGADVALLTPYRPQAAFLSALVRSFQARDKITVGTVHRFQGAERTAVVLDLADAPPLALPGLPLQGGQGARLMTVGTSRAKEKLVIFADRRLLQQSAPPGDMLRQCEIVTISARPDDLLVGSASLRWVSTLAEAEKGIQAALDRGLVWCWLSPDVPPSLRRAMARVPKPRSAPVGQALVIAEENVWLFARPREWVAIHIRDARVARALWQLLEGSKIPAELRVRRGGEDGERAPTLGLPLCTCGSPMTLELEKQDWNGPVVRRVCHACGKRQPASADDLTRWAHVMRVVCPDCGAAVVGRQGTRGLFYGCSQYPHCKGTIDLKKVF